MIQAVRNSLSMRTSIVFVALLCIVRAVPISTKLEDDSSDISYLTVDTESEIYHIGNLTGPIPRYEADESDLRFFFSNKMNPQGVEIGMRDTEAIRPLFSPGQDTMFIVHGWQNSAESPIENIIKQAALVRTDMNIFGVDWRNIAGKTYLEAFSAVPEVGRVLGELIQVLIDNNGLDLGRTTIVGHSLGAHVAGRAGATLRGQVSRIVGLDPAGPNFSYENINNRLDSTNGKFVQIIHTNAAILGFRKPLGHADYYPNGGEFQPGCTADVSGSCSHGRSYEYFAESILTGGFKARDGNIITRPECLWDLLSDDERQITIRQRIEMKNYIIQ
ncbi:hypothetical protein JTB14_010647 [Gonioctena quinquepunctata]|nr:hypothetical protein JTB14_010647 [Gonioctena quinquepunctata]